MKTDAAVELFLDQVTAWARQQPDLQAAALVGSQAHGTARPDSDIDLVLLADEPGLYLRSTTWVERFGQPLRQQVEDYGRLTSLRVWYQDGPEVEFGLSDPGWAALPLDAGTRRVLTDGARLLFERGAALSPALAECGQI